MVKALTVLGFVALLVAAIPAFAQQPTPSAAAPNTANRAAPGPDPSPPNAPVAQSGTRGAASPTAKADAVAPTPPDGDPTATKPQAASDSSLWLGAPTSPDYRLQSSSLSSEPLPPPEPDADASGKMPDFSIRIDPLNWLLAGRLGFELETELWKFVTAEAIPVFVVDAKPPLLNLSGIPDTLRQESAGLGALAGGSLGVGFWLSGKPFQGTVLRFYGTNYAYKYTAKDNRGVIDSVKHTERFLVGMLGFHTKWGPFTIATGVGLGVELNRQKRCAIDGEIATKGCPDDEIVIRVQRETDASAGKFAAITGNMHPMYLLGRVSLGFVL